MMNRRHFVAALAAVVATGPVASAQASQVDVYLDPT